MFGRFLVREFYVWYCVQSSRLWSNRMLYGLRSSLPIVVWCLVGFSIGLGISSDGLCPPPHLFFFLVVVLVLIMTWIFVPTVRRNGRGVASGMVLAQGGGGNNKGGAFYELWISYSLSRKNSAWVVAIW
jgi:hypothetical protein